MSTARQELLKLLSHKSFRLGEFKLSSGGTSDYYIDCRTTTLDARGAQLVGEVFLEEILKQGWEADAIGGLTMGADPIVVAVAVTSGALNGFLVRKAEKQHGTGQRIEGYREKGARVVIVDDVCTTGSPRASERGKSGCAGKLHLDFHGHRCEKRAFGNWRLAFSVTPQTEELRIE